MDQDDTPSLPAPAGWLEALDRSEADLAAGRVVSGDSVMQRLRRTIAEMEADDEGGAEASKAALQR